MMESFLYSPKPSGNEYIPVAVTPTPVPDYKVVPIEAPTGWVMAGFLALLLVTMLYKSFKRFVISLFKKTKTS